MLGALNRLIVEKRVCLASGKSPKSVMQLKGHWLAGGFAKVD